MQYDIIHSDPMKYEGCLLAVENMAVSKQFYTDILHQEIIIDLGTYVTFNGFNLLRGYAEFIGLQAGSEKYRTTNFELYFEVEDLEATRKELKKNKDLKWVHDVKEYPWGQNVIRIYDPDMHIIEISEPMSVVVKRFLEQGRSVEEVAELTMFPVEFVKQLL